MLWPRLINRWENMRTSLWFVPTLCIALAVALSVILVQVDQALSGNLQDHPEWFFSGDASAARSVLAVLAATLITVISLVFSVVILVLQQASTQFTPRLIANFMRHPGNQIVLGTYLATFLYALLILRQVRSGSAFGGEFVPAISITVALLLAIVCLGLLIYFIHHTAISLEASAVTQHVQAHLLEAIERLYPEAIGLPVDDVEETLNAFLASRRASPSVMVHATSSGYIRAIDIDTIIEAAGEAGWVAITPLIGSYVTRGQPIVEAGGVSELSDNQTDQLRGAFILDRERTLWQDPLFGVRQLVDVALKALSAAINDPTTAEYALACLGDVLASLADRPLPSRIRVVEREGASVPHVELWINRPTFADYVDTAFSQIRRAARDDIHVTLYLLDVIRSVGRCACWEDRVEPLQQLIDEILQQMERADFLPAENALIRQAAEWAEAEFGLCYR